MRTRSLKIALTVIAAASLVACGGGGGGGSATLGAFVQQNRDVPFATPTLVTTAVSLAAATTGVVAGTPIMDSFTADLTGTGAQNVIIAGRQSSVGTWTAGVNDNDHQDSYIRVLGWQTINGVKTLVDQTSTWLSGTDNRIAGTEPSVKFADLNNDGKLDMVVAPSTDGIRTANDQAYVFINNGTNFTRSSIALPWQWAHDMTIADLTGTGKQDLIFTDYGIHTSIAFNNGAGSFTVSRESSSGSAVLSAGASSVAAADFTTNGNTGQKQLVFTDDTTGRNQYNGAVSKTGQSGSGVYSWSLNGSTTVVNGITENLVFTKHLALPPSPFSQEFQQAMSGSSTYGKDSKSGLAWSTFGFGSGTGHAPDHTIRAITYDIDNDGYQDVIAVSRPWLTGSQWPNYSEVQFIRNMCGTTANCVGHPENITFTDVTGTVRVGYNTATAASYQPQIITGLLGANSVALLLSGNGFDGNSAGTAATANTQLLVQTTSDGTTVVTPSNVRWVAAYTKVLTAFAEQAKAMQTLGSGNNSGTINIIKGPDNIAYFLTMISYKDSNNVVNQAVYMSKIGDTSTTTAPTLYNAVTQTWPYLSPAAVNQTLSSSSISYFGFGSILNPEAAMSPIGDLGLPLNGRLGALTQLNGYITGVKMSANDTKVAAVDSLRRDFQVDMAPTVVQGESANMWGSSTNLQSDEEYTAQSANFVGGSGASIYGAQLSSDDKNYSIGGPLMRLGKNTMLNVQYTSLNFNPWLSMAGSWGTIKGTGTTELVTTYRENGYSAQLGLMHTATDLTPGLVTRVNDIYGMWAEGGYQTKNFSVHAGIKPVMVSGSVDVHMPTSVNSDGVVQYTNKTFGLQSYVNGYVRANYTHNISKTVSMNYSGIAIDNGQYRAMAVLKIGM